MWGRGVLVVLLILVEVVTCDVAAYYSFDGGYTGRGRPCDPYGIPDSQLLGVATDVSLVSAGGQLGDAVDCNGGGNAIVHLGSWNPGTEYDAGHFGVAAWAAVSFDLSFFGERWLLSKCESNSIDSCVYSIRYVTSFLLLVYIDIFEVSVRIDGVVHRVYYEIPPFFAYGALHHMALTYDGVTIRFYLDGANVASAEVSGRMDSCVAQNCAVPAVVCNEPPAGQANSQWKGQLADLVYFNHAPSGADIADLYAERRSMEVPSAKITPNGSLVVEYDAELLAVPEVVLGAGPGDPIYAWTATAGCSEVEFLNGSETTRDVIMRFFRDTRVTVQLSVDNGVLCVLDTAVVTVLGRRPELDAASLTVTVPEGQNTTVAPSATGMPAPAFSWQQQRNVTFTEVVGNTTVNGTRLEWVEVFNGPDLDVVVGGGAEDGTGARRAEEQWRIVASNRFGTDMGMLRVVAEPAGSGVDEQSDDGLPSYVIGLIAAGGGTALLLALLAACLCLCLVVCVLCGLAVVVVLAGAMVVAVVAAAVTVVGGGGAAVVASGGAVAVARKQQRDGVPESYRELDFSEVQVGELIGAGHFGRVSRGTWRGADVAIKELTVELSEQSRDELRREATLMQFLGNHPHVVSFVGAVTVGAHCCLVTEYMMRGSMYDVLIARREPVSRDVLLRMVGDAAAGLSHLHSEGVLHRDIAARNMLVDERYRVCVADFGTSRFVDATADAVAAARNRRVREAVESAGAAGDVGPVRWMAPECLRASQSEHSRESDAWMFGVFLYEVAALRMPYEGHSLPEVVGGVLDGSLTLDPPADADPVLAHLMSRLLVTDPAARMSMPAVKVYLAHNAGHAPLRPKSRRMSRAPVAGNDYVAATYIAGK